MKIQKHSDEAVAAAVQLLREHFTALAKDWKTHYIREKRIGDNEFTATFIQAYQDPDVQDPHWDDEGRCLDELKIGNLSESVR